jgi:hypothetical protein
MPPDVLLLLASSGLTLVASLMFLVSEERPPFEREDDPRLHVRFCLPPLRLQHGPPPLPARADCAVNLSTAGLHSVLTMRPAVGNDEWLVTLECAPVPDSPALQVRGSDGTGAVTDLRWHGRAGLAKPTRRQWRQKPGRA